MHELETGGLLKYSFGLTLKALCPTSLERKNVKLALKVFSRSVLHGLLEFKLTNDMIDISSTAEFIRIICTWFDIANVKTPNKGKRFQNIYQEPLTLSDDDERFHFMNKFVDWLDFWQKQNCTTGTLSKETFTTLRHSSYAIIEMARYCIEELKHKYFLPGKVQTDALENRFGKYRQLSGSQYNISITQIFESEMKLGVQNTLPSLNLMSSKYGICVVDEFRESQIYEIHENLEWKENNLVLELTSNDFKQIQFILPILTYLGGYCMYKILRKLKCEFCNKNLTLDKTLDLGDSYSFIKSVDRGGLTCPHPDIVTAICYNYVIVTKLLTENYESKFLKLKNQRLFVVNLTFQTLIEKECISYDECEEGHTIEFILKHVLQSATNTLLKNYCCEKNDVPRVENRKRKLRTLEKV